MIKHNIAYVSRHIYPDPTAAALQTIQMAAALASQSRSTSLFVHSLGESEDQVRQDYGVDHSRLQIWSLHTNHWPNPFHRNAKARFLTYNSMVAVILGLHPAWRRASGQRKTLIVRSRLELLYWGLLRPYLWWLRDWIFLYEAHDLSLDSAGDIEKRRTRTQKALANFDVVICVTHSLAKDISVLTHGIVRPVVLSLCSGVPRLPERPRSRLNGQFDRITLGYIGTIDRLHGVSDLLEALDLLPGNVVLRLVGRVGVDTQEALERWMEAPAISDRVDISPAVNYSEVAAEIDVCDILLAPAGDTEHSREYRSPLKLFDYMARGKPIVASGVPSHMELLHDGKNARLYRPGDPEELAACVMSLVEQPRQAEAIACRAWEQSTSYTYDARARRILELVDEARERRKNLEA